MSTPSRKLTALLQYVQVAKQAEAVKGHQRHSAEDDAWHMGASWAYQDIEKILQLRAPINGE